jgi:hypothetical protein
MDVFDDVKANNDATAYWSQENLGRVNNDPKTQPELQSEGREGDDFSALSLDDWDEEADGLSEQMAMSQARARCAVLRIASPLITALIERKFETKDAEKKASTRDDMVLAEMLQSTLDLARSICRSVGARAGRDADSATLWKCALTTSSDIIASHWRRTGMTEVPVNAQDLTSAAADLITAAGFLPEDEYDHQESFELLGSSLSRIASIASFKTIHAESRRFCFWKNSDEYEEKTRLDILKIAIHITRALSDDDTPDRGLHMIFRVALETTTTAWAACHREKTRMVIEETRGLPDEEKRLMQQDYKNGRRDPGVMSETRLRAAKLAAEAASISVDELMPLLSARQI